MVTRSFKTPPSRRHCDGFRAWRPSVHQSRLPTTGNSQRARQIRRETHVMAHGLEGKGSLSNLEREFHDVARHPLSPIFKTNCVNQPTRSRVPLPCGSHGSLKCWIYKGSFARRIHSVLESRRAPGFPRHCCVLGSCGRAKRGHNTIQRQTPYHHN